MSLTERSAKVAAAVAACQGHCSFCGGMRNAEASSSIRQHFRSPKTELATELWSAQFQVTKGTPLRAVRVGATKTIQGRSGFYTDGNGKQFYLAVDAQGTWRQILDAVPEGPLDAWSDIRLSLRVPVLARLASDSTAKGVWRDLSIGRSGFYKCFDKFRWSEEPQYWAEHPATKVFGILIILVPPSPSDDCLKYGFVCLHDTTVDLGTRRPSGAR